MKITVNTPSQFNETAKEQFKDLVLKSGQVTSDGLGARIAKAHYIATVMIAETLVAVAAVKNNRSRQSKYEKMSRVSLSNDSYLGEFGWLCVCEKHRRNGFADIVTIALIASAKPKGLFATIRASNVAARRLHERRGFISAGNTWASESGDDSIMLYIRP